jgi:lysophospholipase L1-like esterase
MAGGSVERRTWRLRVIAALLGLAAALATTELSLRLFLPQPLGVSYRAPSGLTLHVPGASVRFRRLEFDNMIHINSLGLRDREISVRKPRGVFRVLVLGDSFAEGKQVALEETFPKRLERALEERFPQRRWEVINGGVSGYGTADEIKFFELLGSTFDPDLVILEFCVGNDVGNNAASPYFRLHDSRLEELPLERPTARELWLARLREFGAAHSHVYQFLRDRYHRTASSAPEALEESPVQIVMPADEAGWRLTEALLDRLLELVDEAGARFFLVAIPQRVQVYDDEWRASTGHRAGDATRVEPQLRLIAYARRLLLPFVDPLSDLHDANAGGRTYYRIDGHLNARGHRIVADAILESLVKFGLVGETPVRSP